MYVLHVPSEQDHIKNFSYAYNIESKWIFVNCGSLRVKHQFFFALMNEPPLYYTCAGSYDDDWLNDWSVLHHSFMLVFTNVFDLLFANLLNDIVFNKDDQLTLNSVAATLSFWEFSSPKTVVTKSDIIHFNQWTNYYRLLHCSSGS